jgi:hypothetical protein
VFNLLRKAGLRLKIDKCYFARLSVEYLGHIVSEEGVAPNPSKIEAIAKYPPPKNLEQLRTYLGLTGYYRKFVRDYAKLVQHLTRLTKKNVPFQWGEDQEIAFQELKSRLTKAPLLRYSDFSRPFFIHCDASGYGIGSVLGQVQKNVHNADELEVVIGFASKHLNESESKWPIIEKEAFSIVHAVQHYYPYLYGRRFQVYTDHRPLEWLMSKKESSGRLARWSLLLQEFDMEIVYRPGKINQNADCLSRTPVNVIASSFSLGTPSINFIGRRWAVAQDSDPYCQERFRKSESGEIEREEDRVVRLENGLLGTADGRLMVPAELREEILRKYHDQKVSGHTGTARGCPKLGVDLNGQKCIEIS